MWRQRLEYVLRNLGSCDAPIGSLLNLAHEISQMGPPQLHKLGLRRVPSFEILLRGGRWDDAARELVGTTSTILHFELPDDLVVVGIESDYAKGTYSGPTAAHAILGAWLNMLLALCDKVSRNHAYLDNVESR